MCVFQFYLRLRGFRETVLHPYNYILNKLCNFCKQISGNVCNLLTVDCKIGSRSVLFDIAYSRVNDTLELKAYTKKKSKLKKYCIFAGNFK